MSDSTHPLGAEDALDLKNVHDAQISPDGQLAAFTVSDTFKVDTKKAQSRIWVARADGAWARPFTSGPRADEQPRWSPDGGTLAFLSDRVEDGRAQIYLMPRDGGEARALTGGPGNILALQWSRDGKRIAFLMEDPESDAERKRKEAKDDAVQVERAPKYARVWIVDVETRQLRQITHGDVHVWEFDWSPDNSDFALIASDRPFEHEWYRPRLLSVSANGGTCRTLYTPVSRRQLAMPRWSPDRRQIAFITCLWSDRNVIAGDLCVLEPGAEPLILTSNSKRDVSSVAWSADGGSLLVMGYENGDAMVGRIGVRDGGFRRWWTGAAAFADRSWQRFTLSRDQSCLAAVREDPTHPPDVFVARIQDDGLEWAQISRVNPQAEKIEIGRMEKLQWTSTDGRTVQGYVIQPTGYEPGRRYPMVVWVHGGPASNYGPRYYALSSRAQLLAANGFLVLLPNPRGSVGWGTAFTESNVGDLGGMDWQDILSGVDYCIARGLADPERLGLAGWSYGGFMAAWGITQTDRFKAAMVGAGITDWLSFHGTSNLSVWDAIANAANPFERGGSHDKFSPITLVMRVKTPTLILHGEIDPYVPVGQGYELYRALTDYGVEVEMVVYPREGHSVLEENHQLDIARRVVDWFRVHLV